MLTNTSACILNFWREKDGDRFQLTVLDAVHWESEKAQNIREDGKMSVVDLSVVFIPFSVNAYDLNSRERKFLPEKEFLKTEDKSRYFTISKNQRICKGMPNKNEFSSLSDFKSGNETSVNIMSVKTHDFGSPSMQHWELTGM